MRVLNLVGGVIGFISFGVVVYYDLRIRRHMKRDGFKQ
jgi:hypothetical protein